MTDPLELRPRWIILLTDRAADIGASILVYGCRRGRNWVAEGGEPLTDLRDAVCFLNRPDAEVMAADFMADNPRWLATVADAPAAPDDRFVPIAGQANDPRRN